MNELPRSPPRTLKITKTVKIPAVLEMYLGLTMNTIGATKPMRKNTAGCSSFFGKIREKRVINLPKKSEALIANYERRVCNEKRETRVGI